MPMKDQGDNPSAETPAAGEAARAPCPSARMTTLSLISICVCRPNAAWVKSRNAAALSGVSMYDEARKQYQLRAQLTGYAGADELEAETTARAAAHRQYVACLSGQGYRTLYAN